MAHLLEHMVFKGTPDHPDIPKELSNHGARPNGTTYYDRTNYFETFNATEENLDWALDLEADRMMNSYIAKEDLTPPLRNRLLRIAAFQNPEFYKKQNLRLSTALTPRVISCADDHEKHISLPRGCLDDVRMLLHAHKSQLDLEDLRQEDEPIEATFLRQLTADQRQAAKAILEHDNGVVVASPGFGKTVLGTYLIAQRKCSTLILVHRQPLL